MLDPVRFRSHKYTHDYCCCMFNLARIVCKCKMFMMLSSVRRDVIRLQAIDRNRRGSRLSAGTLQSLAEIIRA